MSELSVQRVWRDYKGSVISETLTIGATEVDVENIVDFDEAGGDFVLGADSGTYSGFTESDTDETAGTVVGLDPPVTIAHPKGTFLYDGDHPRGPKRADGFLDGDDSLVEGVLIPAHLRRYFPSGKRLPEDMEVVDVAFDEDGSPYINDADFDEESAVEPVVFTWSLTGNVSVGTRVHRFQVPFGGTIEEVKLTMGTGGAPVGSSIIVDILKGGASILGTKVIVPDGELDSDNIEPTTKEVTKGNIIQVEFEQVGSTTPGSNPTLYMTMFPSEGAIAGRIEVAGPTGPAGADGVISEVQDEGVALADQSIMNFTGAGVTATVAGGKYVVTIPGGGTPSFVGARVYRNVTQAIAHNTLVAVEHDSEDVDTSAFHDLVTNPHRLTIPVGYAATSRWRVSGRGGLDPSAAGTKRQLLLWKNSTLVDAAETIPGSASYNPRLFVGTICTAGAGDYFYLDLFQDAGVSLNTLTGSARVWFEIEYLGG